MTVRTPSTNVVDEKTQQNNSDLQNLVPRGRSNRRRAAEDSGEYRTHRSQTSASTDRVQTRSAAPIRWDVWTDIRS